MKTKFLAIFVTAATAAGTAAAADLPRNPAPYYYPPPAIFNWTGFYAGLNLGYQWGSVSNFSGNPSGIAGGGQIGYNWQVGQFVFGAETDIEASAADDTFAPWQFSNPWFWYTARPRWLCDEQYTVLRHRWSRLRQPHCQPGGP